MSDQSGFELNLNDPQSIEAVYRQAVRDQRVVEFEQEIRRLHGAAPDSPLPAAWYYRLQAEAQPVAVTKPRQVTWRLAIPFSLVLGVIYWLLAPDLTGEGLPWNFLVLWAPITACVLIVFLFLAEQSSPLTATTAPAAVRFRYTRSALIVLVIVAVTVVACITHRNGNDVYRTLLILHLPLLCILAVWLFIARPLDDQNGFAGLHKWAEIILTAGIMAGAVLAFDIITLGLFSAIGITPVAPVLRWLIFGMPGFIPVIAFAMTYVPGLAILQQHFDQGLIKPIFNIARLLLPLSIIVGAIYLVSIPANFFMPFQQRDVLIIYNIMLFAVMALLVLATPLQETDVPENVRAYLRWAIIILSVMAVVVSVYALSATVYRTVMLGGLTVNRLTITGWNVLNIGILCAFLALQIRKGRASWIVSMQRVTRLGLIGYIVWSLFVVLAIPLLNLP